MGRFWALTATVQHSMHAAPSHRTKGFLTASSRNYRKQRDRLSRPDIAVSRRSLERATRGAHFPDERRLLRLVWPAVGSKDVVEPGRRLVVVGLLPGVPGIDGLGLPLNEAPVDRAHVVSPRKRQRPFERAAFAARHVLGADERPVVAAECDDLAL